MKRVKLFNENNLEALKKLPENSIDSVVTDAPYGLSFMNKKWDYDVPSVDFWKEVYRVLKPGGHVLSFGGTRTYHRMVVNMEDAGFEIRDQIMWCYSQGFPKSHNIGKAIDKMNGVERKVVAKDTCVTRKEQIGEWGMKEGEYEITKGSSEFEGWGSALKPAVEPICLSRKPLSEKSVAENVLKWKTGGINVDGCRVGSEIIEQRQYDRSPEHGGQYGNHSERVSNGIITQTEGRFPANIILECCCDEVIEGEKGEVKKSNRRFEILQNKSEGKVERIENYGDKGDIHTNPECPCYIMDQQSGVSKSRTKYPEPSLDGMPMNHYEETKIKHISGKEQTKEFVSDKGGASRFFYQAKVSKAERNMGLDGFEEKIIEGRDSGQDERSVAFKPRPTLMKNTHPTVKPINLLTYLCRLVTPPNGIVLDPFMGSGSTGIAAQLEGFRFCGMELEPDYFKIAEARIENFEKYKKFIK